MSATDEGDWPKAIGRPARQALVHAGLLSFADLAARTEKEVLALHGMGPKALGILKEMMAEQGLAFRPSHRAFPE